MSLMYIETPLYIEREMVDLVNPKGCEKNKSKSR